MRDFTTAAAGKPIRTAAVMVFQSSGQFARWNPHWHGLFLEGGFDQEGRFLHVPTVDLAKMRRHNNIVKHARASTARIAVCRRNLRIRIRVEDDGIGMSPTDIETVRGFGLFSIRERLTHMGGTMEIDSKPGATHVLLEAPLSLVRGTGSTDRTGS